MASNGSNSENVEPEGDCVDHDQVLKALHALDNALAGPVTVATRVEVAAAALATACTSAFESAAAQDEPHDAKERYDLTEQLIVQRARELADLLE